MEFCARGLPSMFEALCLIPEKEREEGNRMEGSGREGQYIEESYREHYNHKNTHYTQKARGTEHKGIPFLQPNSSQTPEHLTPSQPFAFALPKNLSGKEAGLFAFVGSPSRQREDSVAMHMDKC